MSAAMKLTAAQRKALLWIKRNEPVSMFPCDGEAPSIRFVKKLREIGLVKEVGKDGHKWGFTTFAVSDLGIELLAHKHSEPAGAAS